MKYGIFFEGQSNGYQQINYRVISSNPQNVIVKIYDTYLDHILWSSELTLIPDVSYYTYYPAYSKNRLAYFYDAETNDLVGLFALDGYYFHQELDYKEFVKKTSFFIDDQQKHNLLAVFFEIMVKNLYHGDFIDVNEGDVVVDIGFNFGLFTIKSLYKNPSKIIAFEPNKNISKYFKEFINDDRVTIHDVAVSNKNGFVNFYEQYDSGMSTLIGNEHSSKSTYEVPVVNFKDFIFENSIDKIDYLKVDCEGSEFDIFESIDENYLKNNIKKIAVEFHDYLESINVQRLISKLKFCDFEIKIENNIGSPMLGMIYAKK